MDIYLASSWGSGRTELSAFDNALFKAGVANFNLIQLSSIIPPKSIMHNVESLNWNNKGFGDKLYCVMARCTTSTPGAEAWAGIGYVKAKDGSGLFVEHHAHSEDELKRHINYSLEDMRAYRDVDYGNISYIISNARCINMPVCALAVAVYAVESW